MPTATRRRRKARTPTPAEIRSGQQQRLADLHASVAAVEARNKVNSLRREDADRQRAHEQARRRERWAKVARGADGARHAVQRAVTLIGEKRPMLVALAMYALCASAALMGQLMVYTAIDWHGWGAVAYLLACIVEGGAFSLGIFASWQAARGWAHAGSLRLMWLFAVYAGVSNGWNFVVNLGEVVTGVLLGGASVVGPLVWHRYVSLTYHARAGRTVDKVRAAIRRALAVAARLVFHPLLSLRAVGTWSAWGGELALEAAWRLEWTNRKGAAPGLRAATATPVAMATATSALDADWQCTDEALRQLLDEEWRNSPDGGSGATTATLDRQKPRPQDVAPPQPPAQPQPQPPRPQPLRRPRAQRPAAPARRNAATPQHDPATDGRNPQPQSDCETVRIIKDYVDEKTVKGEKPSPTEAGKLAGVSHQRASVVIKRLRLRVIDGGKGDEGAG